MWADVDVAGRFARLPRTKNGEPRAVPLSRAALALLERLPSDGASVFGLSSASLDTLFRRARQRAGIEGLTFHDSRHEAVTRLARKLDVLDLARMIGHRDLKSLQVYYNATPSEIAARLD
jgi:integrase